MPFALPGPSNVLCFGVRIGFRAKIPSIEPQMELHFQGPGNCLQLMKYITLFRNEGRRCGDMIGTYVYGLRSMYAVPQAGCSSQERALDKHMSAHAGPMSRALCTRWLLKYQSVPRKTRKGQSHNLSATPLTMFLL